MASDWKETPLAAVINVKHGFAFSGENIREEPPGDILLTPGNFAIGGGFKGDKFKYFDGEVPEEYVLNPGDLVVTMTDLSKQADTLGYPAIVPTLRGPRFLHNQRLGKIIIKPNAGMDDRFLFYLLRTAEYRHEVLASATGTTVKHTSPGRILAHKANIPPLAEQKAIAQILGALDDKIELNRRMNATLEAMARALFQSWFVDAAATNRPKGWREGTLGEVTDNPRRGIQPEEIKPSTPYIGLEHMPRRCIALSDWGHADTLESNKFEFKRGEIMFGKLRPYFHKVGVAPLDGVCSTDILVVRPKAPAWFGFVLGHVSSVELVNHTNAASTGTKMPRASWNDIARFEVALPPESAAAEFTDLIRPMIDRIIASVHESRTLAELRDTLLPKLLSGELRAPADAKYVEDQ
jgi:type I restriction enzyme S subunit